MKIVAIEAIPVEVPRSAKTRIVASYSSLPSAKFVIAVVRTDEGVEGIGEASPEYQWTGEDEHTCVTAIQIYLAPKKLVEAAIHVASPRIWRRWIRSFPTIPTPNPRSKWRSGISPESSRICRFAMSGEDESETAFT